MPLQGFVLGQGHPLSKKAWKGGHVSKPLGFWILPQLSDCVKRGFTTFFFFLIWPRSAVWLCPPPCSRGLAAPPAPPRAQAPAPLPWLFLPAGITSERVTFPEGRCHSRGDSRQRPSRGAHHPERLFPGCGGSQRRGFWRGCLWRDREGELSLQKGAACLAPEASSWLSLCLAETGRAQSGSCCEFPGHE